MKRCPVCNKQFPDDANFCPVDAGRLEEDVGDAQPAAASDVAPGGPLGGRFTLGRRLGGGRTGEVFQATDEDSNEPVAVKLVDPRVFPTAILLQRGERELKQLEKVNAREVVRVLGHGKQGERVWIATELFPGEPLDKVVASGGRLQGARAAGIVRAIGSGLAEAARAGVIHRDLSPKNVLLGQGDSVKVINFCCPLPYSDKIQGVVEFVSPEEAEGKPVDQRANLYSLGALLYFLVTGRPPHEGTPEEVLRARLASDPPRPSSLAPVDEALEAIAMKALERSSARRFMTINQMVEALAGLGSDAATAAVPAGKPQPQPAAARTMIGMGLNASELLAAAGHTPAPQPPVASRAATPAPQAAPVAMAGPPAGSSPPPAAVSPAALANVANVANPTGKRNKLPDAASGSKGKFRETMWFKKGELDEAAAQAVAQASANPSADSLALDKADSLPIEDRYQDDGTLSNKDRDRLSLRTGATMMMDAVNPKPAGKPVAGGVSEKELVGELRGGRGPILIAIVVGLLILGIIVALVV